MRTGPLCQKIYVYNSPPPQIISVARTPSTFSMDSWTAFRKLRCFIKKNVNNELTNSWTVWNKLFIWYVLCLSSMMVSFWLARRIKVLATGYWKFDSLLIINIIKNWMFFLFNVIGTYWIHWNVKWTVVDLDLCLQFS